MKEKLLLQEIKDTDFNPEYKMGNVEEYKIRRGSRGILVKDGKIALLNVTKHNYHKLPGGGIDGDETKEEAFNRENIEEVGCETKILDYAGIIIEWRDQFKILQINYVFFGEVVGEVGENKLMPDEIEDGHILEWVSIEKIKEVLGNDDPTTYESQFITTRDKTIIGFYEERLKALINS